MGKKKKSKELKVSKNFKNIRTLKSIIVEWLQIKQITLKESTYYRYVYMINQYILPYFNEISMEELEKYDLNKFILYLMKTLKPASIRDVVNLLKSILKYSKNRYSYNFDLDFIVIPKSYRKELRVLTTREITRLENYCLREQSLRDIGIIVCLNTGMRIGEICALKWGDINLEKKSIKIEKTMQRVYKKIENKTEVIVDKPKSNTSIRTIPISNKLYNILKPLKKIYKQNTYFLTGSQYTYIEPRNYQYMFEQCLKKCRIKNFHFHQLRHSFASNCINVGMDPKALSEILGHSDVHLTLNKYVHSSLKNKKRYMEKL